MNLLQVSDVQQDSREKHYMLPTLTIHIQRHLALKLSVLLGQIHTLIVDELSSMLASLDLI